MRQPNRVEYEEALFRWHNARKTYKEINHGPEPRAIDYGFRDTLELWEADKIRKRVEREVNRTQ